MILVRRWLYYTLGAVVCLGVLGAGVLGYYSVQTVAAGSAEYARFVAERFLFTTLTAAVILCIIFVYIALRSLSIDRELDKIIELNRFQDFSPEKSMNKLGIIGKKITALYYQLNTLNEKKSLKISAQSELLAFLTNNLELPLAICDVTGTVIWVSPSFLEKIGKTRPEIVGGRIDSIIPDISVQNILFELGRSHSFLEKSAGKSTVTCYPVYNRRNELTYLALALGKKAVYSEAGKKTDVNQVTQPSRLQRAFGRALSRKGTEW